MRHSYFEFNATKFEIQKLKMAAEKKDRINKEQFRNSLPKKYHFEESFG
jgi:hypothetical protein